MSFSYTEKKELEGVFEKISSVMELPNLLATQVQSYDAFLQRYVDSDKRLMQDLNKFLILSSLSKVIMVLLMLPGFTLGEPIFDERECKWQKV